MERKEVVADLLDGLGREFGAVEAFVGSTGASFHDKLEDLLGTFGRSFKGARSRSVRAR